MLTKQQIQRSNNWDKIMENYNPNLASTIESKEYKKAVIRRKKYKKSLYKKLEQNQFHLIHNWDEYYSDEGQLCIDWLID